MNGPVVALCPCRPGESLDVGPLRAAKTVAGEAGAPVAAILVEAADRQIEQARSEGDLVVWDVRHADLSPLDDAERRGPVFVEALKQSGLGDFRLAVLPAGHVGAALAAAIGKSFDAAVLGACAEIVLTAGGVEARRSTCGGRVEIVVAADGRCVVATRDASQRGPSRRVGEVRPLRLATPLPDRRPVERVGAAGRDRSVATARVVIAGGRGIGGDEGFDRLRDLAGCLDGAVGGSLPAVDAGWVPVSAQVGQSGQFVAPEVYVAVGVSGTPQHLAGVGAAARIVAINTDVDADIFRFADVGIVAAWRDVVPALVRRLRSSPEAFSPDERDP